MARSSRFEPQPPDRSSAGVRGSNPTTGASGSNAEAAGAPEGLPDLLTLMARAQTLSEDYQARTLEDPVGRSYRAWNNQHAKGSKYLGTAWRNRSSLFVPKTRSAVRKNLATAATALFSTEDVVNVEAEYQDDQRQMATAAVMKADLDYRLNRSSPKSGMPWFLLAMGACFDAQLTGVCVSKQYWEYQEVETGEVEPVEFPLIDEATGEPYVGEDGNPLFVTYERPVKKVVRDRPMVELIPIENVGVDPAAPWYDPAQLGRWFYVAYPIGLSDARALMSGAGKGGADTGWISDLPDEVLLKGRPRTDHSGVRRNREAGGDRYETSKAPGELDLVWMQENFIRINGIDWHFWSVGSVAYASKVRRTEEAYPELGGERPYKFGVAQLEPHRVFPMSPVESWQPLQLEINDVTNLRQDTLKRSIAPLAVIRKGRNVDTQAVQRRGQPDAMIFVQDEKDVTFVQTPGPTGAAYTETSVNSAMFDELAGVFSTSSVQSNRQLNETVGGMRLMSGAANAVTEFDLRTWVETWAEPVLRQLMLNLRYFESDEKILAIAGGKARAWEDHQYMPTFDDFDATEVTLRVNVGIGAMDPMAKLGKLKVAFEMLAPMVEGMKAQGIDIDYDTVIREVMGGAGFRDGRRFFKYGEASQGQQNPEILKVMEELKLERERIAIEHQKIQARLKEVELNLRSDELQSREDNQTKIAIETMKGRREVAKQMMGAAQAHQGRQHDAAMAREGRQHDVAQAREGRAHEIGQAREGRAHEAAQAREARAAEGGGASKPGTSKRDRVVSILTGKAVQGAGAPPQGGGEALVPMDGGSSGAPAGRQGQPADQAQHMLMLAVAKMMQTLDGIGRQVNVQGQALQAMVEQTMAPAEIVRDPASGLPIGVRKGRQFHQIARGADQRILGTVPAGGRSGVTPASVTGPGAMV